VRPGGNVEEESPGLWRVWWSGSRISEGFNTRGDAQDLLDNLNEEWGLGQNHIGGPRMGGVGGVPKFSQYQPSFGVEGTYREVLLAMRTHTRVLVKFDNYLGRYVAKDVDGNILFDNKYEDRLREDLKAAGYYAGGAFSLKEQPYKSPHWEEGNVLVHMRMKDVVLPDGKRFLYLIEVQSDLHQEGREKGYIGGASDAGNIVDEWVKKNPITNMTGVRDVNRLILEEAGAPVEVLNAWEEYLKEPTGQVPDLPFKKSWPELALKRALIYAAEQGYDGIAWSTGEQQETMWGTEVIAWAPDTDNPGGWTVAVQPHRGGAAGGVNIETEAQIRGLIKNLSNQRVTSREGLGRVIREAMGRSKTDAEITKLSDRVWEKMQAGTAGTTMPRREGMNYFYDKMITGSMAKTGKKWGAAPEMLKVVGSNFSNTVEVLDAVESMNDDSGVVDGQLLSDMISLAKAHLNDGWTLMESISKAANSLRPARDGRYKLSDVNDAEQSILSTIEQMADNADVPDNVLHAKKEIKEISVNSMLIPDAMKKSITESGLSLFAPRDTYSSAFYPAFCYSRAVQGRPAGHVEVLRGHGACGSVPAGVPRGVCACPGSGGCGCPQ